MPKYGLNKYSSFSPATGYFLKLLSEFFGTQYQPLVRAVANFSNDICVERLTNKPPVLYKPLRLRLSKRKV